MKRWMLLVFALVAHAALMLALGMVGTLLITGGGAGALDLDDFLRIDDTYWWGLWGFPALIIVATQLCFVWPILATKPLASSGNRPLWVTAAAAAVVASALTCALVFAVLEGFNAFERVMERAFDSNLRSVFPMPFQSWFEALWPWLFIGCGWLLWTPILLRFARKPNGSRWGRWVGLLLGGTILETLIVIPIDIMVRRRTSCYCGTGTFFALVISMWALLWLTGPGIVIAATSRRRRLWRDTHCVSCGYAKGPRPVGICPECGVAW